jgi:hypothetical protein
METLLRMKAFSTETPSPVNQDHKTLRCTFRKKTPTDAPKFKTRCNNYANDNSDTSMPGLLDPHHCSSNHENEDDSDDDNDPRDGDANIPRAPGTTYRHNVVYESLRQASSMLHGINDTDIASACRQVAYLAATITDDVDTAMNTMLLPDETLLDHPHYTLLRDWLIDSGALSHMTNNEADLALNREESNAVVQVANGVLIRAELRGTVRVRIQDLNHPHISCNMLIHDVLYVPGLSRRLLSVDQWNAGGRRNMVPLGTYNTPSRGQ